VLEENKKNVEILKDIVNMHLEQDANFVIKIGEKL
jgi:hypothetical protein